MKTVKWWYFDFITKSSSDQVNYIREPKVYIYMRKYYIIDEELRERLLYLQMIDVSVSDKCWRSVVISGWNITMSID